MTKKELIDFMSDYPDDALQAENLKKRMKHVIEDANTILSHLMDGKPLDGITDYGVRIHTHLDNITIACELDNDEYETWKD